MVVVTLLDEVLFKVMTLKPLLRVRFVGKITLKVGVYNGDAEVVKLAHLVTKSF